MHYWEKMHFSFILNFDRPFVIYELPQSFLTIPKFEIQTVNKNNIITQWFNHKLNKFVIMYHIHTFQCEHSAELRVYFNWKLI